MNLTKYKVILRFGSTYEVHKFLGGEYKLVHTGSFLEAYAYIEMDEKGYLKEILSKDTYEAIEKQKEIAEKHFAMG